MTQTPPEHPEQAAGQEDGQPGQSFVSHLVELRSRLLKSLGAVALAALLLLPFANRLYSLLARPLLEHLPAGATMIATAVTSPFMAPFKLSLFVALFLCVPYLLYQLWAFVAPGLYRHERRLVLPLMLTSISLFYLGAVFAYVAVFPVVFGFFTAVAPEGVQVATDISSYLDFVLMMFFAFGLAFQVPVAVVLLIRAGVTTAEAVAAKRVFVIIAAFLVGAVLTPPDVLSQTMLALPMWLLFEAGLLIARLTGRRTAGAAS